MLAEGRSLIRQCHAIEDRAVELLAERPDYLVLRTIPGIGPINALTILAETGDLRRFRHPLPGNGLLANHERDRQFLKFCGMDLATVQSGVAHRVRTDGTLMGNSAVAAKSQNMAMPACAALCGWQAKRRS